MKTEILRLIVKPNSKVTDVCGVYLDRIKIRLVAPPRKGRANRELIKFISDKIGIPKKFIRIVSGEKSNYKEISVRLEEDSISASKLLTG